MKDALIISCTEQSVLFLKDMLKLASINKVDTVPSCERARENLKEKTYDIVIINSPLRDEFGERLAMEIANTMTEVIMIVKGDCYDKVSEKTESMGIFVVSKPITKPIFWSVLKIAQSSWRQVKKVQEENENLKKTLADVKIVDRAKCLLISYLGMSEQESHKYIEKQAMDMRTTKREVAEGILKTYEY